MRIRGPGPSLVTEVEAGNQLLSRERIEGSRSSLDEEPLASKIEVIETKVRDLRAGQRIHPGEQDREPVIGAIDLIKK